jgi:hypothetical protein
VSAAPYGRRMRPLVLALLSLLATAVPAATATAADDRPIYRVVVFGDSYAAGEGAPGTNGMYNSDGTGGDPRAVWSGSNDDRDFTDDVETGTLGARRCHRSPRATAPMAVKALVAQFPAIDFTFRSFACSGASIDKGLIGPYDGAEPIDHSNQVPAQIDQANDYLASLPSASRRIDALVMNVGGNNLGFGQIIQNCTEIPIGTNPCSPPDKHDTEAILLTGAGSPDPAHTGLDDLPGLFDTLAHRLDRSASGSLEIATEPDHVFITGVPNPLAGDFGGCASLSGQYDYENRLTAAERTWINGTVFPAINNAFQAAAGDRWTFVPLASAITNGICASSGRMINRNRDALVKQGATVASAFGIGVSHGWVHPNASGYAAMAPLLASSMAAKVISDFTPPGAPSSATLVPETELLPRVELDVGAVSTPYDTRPGGNQRGRAGGPAVSAIGATRVPVPVDPVDQGVVLARRCGPLPLAADGTGQGCANGRLMTARLGTPAPPLSVTTAKDPLGVRVTWKQGSTVALRRFQVDLTATSTIGDPTLALVKDIPPIGGARAAQELRTLTLTTGYSFDPSITQAVLPAPAGARVTVKVRECTDRGCGASAPEPVSIVVPPGVDTPDTLARPFMGPELDALPLGAFTIRSGQKARARRPFALVASWAAWRRWRDLREMRIRLRGRDGVVVTLRVGLQNGRLALTAPGGHARRGHAGRRGTVRAGAVALGLRGAHRRRRPAQPAGRRAAAADARARPARAAHRRRGRRGHGARSRPGSAVGRLVRGAVTR